MISGIQPLLPANASTFYTRRKFSPEIKKYLKHGIAQT